MYALSFHTDDAQDVENERHLLELRKVAVQPNFTTEYSCNIAMKVVVELPAMDDRGRVTETQANSFFDQSCPALRSLRLALGAQVRAAGCIPLSSR